MIPTAEDFIEKHVFKIRSNEILIEFAKLHVIEALKQASQKAEVVDKAYHDVEIDTDSIINSYSLKNIK